MSVEPVDPQHFLFRLQQATPRMWVTPTLIGLNGLIWGVMVLSGVSWLSPRAMDLALWGGNFLPFTLREPWRLLSATFLHGGLMHLAFNLWALRDVGRLVERFYGNGQMALIYLVAGLSGSMTSLFFSARTGVSVGASGAIFGLVGALLAALYTQAGLLPPALVASMRSSMLGFVGVSLVLGFTVGFVDNAAHLGGLAAGALMGVVLVEKFDESVPRRVVVGRAMLAMGLAGAGLWMAWWRLAGAAG